VSQAELAPSCSGLGSGRAADPCVVVICGAAGDLTRRELIPSLFELFQDKLLPEACAIIGFSRADWDDDTFRRQMRAAHEEFAGPVDAAQWDRFAACLGFVPGDFTAPVDGPYAALSKRVAAERQRRSIPDNVLFHLATPPVVYEEIVGKLAGVGLDKSTGGWRRVVIEKPFGHSLASARALNSYILRTLHEDQIFRIDHFLGKDTVQSIMAFRFANGLFEPIWNRDRIDHVQLTVAETLGVEQRGNFYETTGALRDMVPNHLFTLMSMVAMEPPTGFDAAAVRSKKAEVFAAIPAVEPARAVRGQYGAGTVRGRSVKAYRNEANVESNSNIETYVAMALEIDNWRWAGVPFFLRTGKHLSQRTTEIAIRFKQAPYAAFQDTSVNSLRPNWLVLQIAPDEGISLQFEVKARGPVMDLAAVKMAFNYDDWFPKQANVGYETLLYDVMIGDATLFMRADMVEQAWRIVQPVLDEWAANVADFPNYSSGSDGPDAADELLCEGSRGWRPIDPLSAMKR